MGLFGGASYYQGLFNRRQQGMQYSPRSGSSYVTGDTGLTAGAFMGKYQQVGGAGSHTYTPRGGGGSRGYVGGWGEMPLGDAARLSGMLGRSKVLPTVGGSGMPLTTGYGKAQGFQRRLMGSMPLGLPPKETEGDGGKLITGVTLAYVLYKVLI